MRLANALFTIAAVRGVSTCLSNDAVAFDAGRASRGGPSGRRRRRCRATPIGANGRFGTRSARPRCRAMPAADASDAAHE